MMSLANEVRVFTWDQTYAELRRVDVDRTADSVSCEKVLIQIPDPFRGVMERVQEVVSRDLRHV